MTGATLRPLNPHEERGREGGRDGESVRETEMWRGRERGRGGEREREVGRGRERESEGARGREGKRGGERVRELYEFMEMKGSKHFQGK